MKAEAAAAPRIVSMIASATEIICALGFEGSLVGRSHACDYPPTIEALPATTAARLRIDVPSREIDRQVREILTQGLSVYDVDAEALKRLQPDIIITQTQCEVCAVSLRDVENALWDWLESRPRIVSLEPNALSDVWADIERVAAALGATEQGKSLVEELQSRMRRVALQTQSIESRPTVACIEWIDPLMAAGNWMPELVEMARGVNLFGEAGKHSPYMTWEDLRARDPEVIVVCPCGFDLKRTREEMPALTRRPDWTHLRAVRDGRVCLTDGNQYFNRPGPRLAESLEILAEIICPTVFDFGHNPAGWEKL